MNASTRTELALMGDMPRSLMIPENELIETLRSSLYAGATDNSIRLVIGYCKAQGLDPMQKPVHIVPMSVKKPGTRDYEWRDVIMPGIGLYRTQAARTGQLAGISEAEFGPMVTENLSGQQITYPEWARVVVKRILPSGHIAEFEAKEYWIENYATAGRDTQAPNAMWKKRTRGQIAKCAEAQALRKGFPEVGSAPTADEMEGKVLGDDDAPRAPRATNHAEAAPTIKHMGAAEVVQPTATPAPPPADTRPAFPDEDFQRGLPVWRKAAGKIPVAEVLARAETANPDYAFTEQQKATILSLKPAEAISFAAVADALQKAQNRDALYVACDLIKSVADEKQRAELTAMFEQRDQQLPVEG